MFETDFEKIKQRRLMQKQYVNDVLRTGMERHLFHAETEPIFEKILEWNNLSIAKTFGRTDSLHCLENYGLSTRSYVALRHRAGATTIEDVALMSEEELRALKPLAKRHVAEILNVIEENHIKENTDWDLYKIE